MTGCSNAAERPVSSDSSHQQHYTDASERCVLLVAAGWIVSARPALSNSGLGVAESTRFQIPILQ